MKLRDILCTLGGFKAVIADEVKARSFMEQMGLEDQTVAVIMVGVRVHHANKVQSLCMVAVQI